MQEPLECEDSRVRLMVGPPGPLGLLFSASVLTAGRLRRPMYLGLAVDVFQLKSYHTTALMVQCSSCAVSLTYSSAQIFLRNSFLCSLISHSWRSDGGARGTEIPQTDD